MSRRLRTPPLFPCPLGRLAHSPFPLLHFLRLPFRYWIATLSASPLLSNAPYISAQIKDLADKLESAEGGISHFGRGGGGGAYLMGGERAKKDDSQLKKIVRDSSKITREHLQGAMTQAMKKLLFNGNDAANSSSAATEMDTS